jgi:hypothetical protein
MDVFNMKNKKLSNLLSCVFLKSYHIFKWDFRRTTLLTYFNVLSLYQHQNSKFKIDFIKISKSIQLN